MLNKYNFSIILLAILVHDIESSTINFSKDTAIWKNFKVNQCRQKCYLEVCMSFIQNYLLNIKFFKKIFIERILF